MNMLRAFIFCAVLPLGVINVRADWASGIKAVVHDSVITSQEVEQFAAPALEVARRQARGDREVFVKKYSEVMTDSLEQLIERQLILHDFEASGFNLPESIIDEAIQERIKERFGDRKTMTKTLQAQGIRYEQFRKQMRDQIVVEALRGRNVSSAVIISPYKIEKYYESRQQDFMVKNQVKLRMITLPKNSEADIEARKLADEIASKVREGASFAEMAGVYSQDGQRTQGGDRGWVEQGGLRAEIDEAAFKLKAGEVAVVETTQTCYVLKVDEVKPAHVRPLNDLRETIEKELLVQERARLAKQYTDRLRKKTFIRYF
jgi:peptidyl-prolyl cis-trans isomerase SurA